MRKGKKIWRSITIKIHRFVLKSSRKIRKLLNRIPGNHRKLILTISEAAGISLIVFGIITFTYFQTINNSYKLSPKLLSVIGSPDQNILRKFSYDKQSKSYFLAKSDIGNKSAGMKSVGDGAVSGYSSRLSLNSSRGITTYDNSQNLSFTLTPEFKTMDARASNGHVIYPTSVNGPKLVYTIKHNGTQEDIVYSKASSNSASYKYRLDLPTGLEAKKTSDGNIGIYSADSYLYGNISYSSDADKQKVDLAKQKAAKNNLVFVIPAPTIVAKGSNKAKTSIELKNNEITISATNLSSIKGAFSIDPSVVVASISSFQNGGNNEGDITYDSTNNQIYQSGIGGGEISSWTTSANSVPRYVSNSLEVIYNNYIYIIGGYDGTTWFANTYYASISSSGNVGPFSLSTSVFPNLSSGVSGAANLGGTAYNGYIFAGAGQNSASATSAGYYFAAVCTGNNTTSQFSVNCDKSSSPGSISSWKAESNSLPAAEQKPNVTAYNGYLYDIQGFSANTYYAKINADGSIGTWSTGSTMPITGAGGYSVIYNNYIYYIGGSNNGSNSYYAQIQSGGNIGSWQSTSSLPATRSIASGAISGGYVYLIGGSSNTTTYFSQINTDGTLGKWQTSVNNLSSSLGTSLNSGINSYNGNLYYINGNGSIFKTTVTAPGLLSGWTSTSSSLSNIKNFESVAYNGYIYVMGGTDGTNYLTTSYYAAICTGQNTTTAFATNCTNSSSAGSLSSWGTTTSLSLASSQGTAVAVNGYMYLMGGLSASSTISNKTYYSAINPDGTLAGWNATTNLQNYIYSAVSVVYGGYIYVIGGVSSATSSVSSGASSSAIYYASYNNSGTVNSWTTSLSVSLPVATQQSTASAYGGYLYLLGGNTGSSTANVYYAQLNSDGSLGAFTLSTNSLPAASAEGCSFVSNGYIYYLGSYNSNTYYAQIASNGSLGSFNSTTSTINPNSSSGLGAMGSVIYQGYAYYMGGWDKTNYNSNTYYSQIFNGGSGQTNGWYTSANLLPNAYTGASVSVYNGKIYLFRNTVLYATLNSDGSIGVWSYTTSPIPFNDFGPSSFMYNGFAYVMGGYNTVTSPYCPSGLGSNWACNDVLRAPINSNGTLGSWTLLSATPMPVGVETFGLQQWNGYVYIFGGLTVNISGVFVPQSVAYYAKINSDGSLGSWTATSNLQSANANFASAVYNGYIYMIGGGYNSNGNKTYYAKINSDGSLGSWNATSSLLENRVGVQSVAYDGYIYVFGGSLGYGYIPPNSTEYAPINANGSIGNWYTSTASSFLVSNSSFEGTSGSGCSSTGWSARNGSSITTSNANSYLGYGSCSLQVTSTTATGGAAYSLTLQPSTTYNLSMNIKASGSTITDLAIGYQNYGVDTAGICPTTTTGYASASGASTTSFTLFYCTFTTPASVTGTVNIYVSATTNAADVFYVDNVVFLTQPGSPSPVLPDSLSAYGLAANNGYVYIVSGASQYSSQGQAFSATSRTYYTALQSIPRIGYYSQLQDLTGSSSQDPTPFELSVNGGACASGSACSTSSINNLPTSGSGGLNGPGGVSIAYAFARNICTAFNSSVNLTYISTLFGTIQPATNTTSACSSPNNAIGNSRYVWTRYTIDDSQTATFPDSLSNKTTISNYNWYYHAANNARLRGGSSFGNNSLQTLDTPP